MANQASGGILLLLMIGFFWIYGFQSQIRNAQTKNYPTTGLAATQQTQSILGNLYILATIFVVIGFGLLLSYFKKATYSALFMSIFTVSFTIILSPILSKFWFNIFITNFQGKALTPSDPTRFLQYSLGGIPIYLDFYNLRIALANSISQLVACLALYGKLNAGQIIVNSIGFNFFWNLNYFLCSFLVMNSPDSRFFDDYQISNVYLFAASYGIISSLLLNNPPSLITEFSSNFNSSVTAHIGTFFLFLSFCATTTMYSLKFSVING
jgi:hypothetical protein